MRLKSWPVIPVNLSQLADPRQTSQAQNPVPIDPLIASIQCRKGSLCRLLEVVLLLAQVTLNLALAEQLEVFFYQSKSAIEPIEDKQ